MATVGKVHSIETLGALDGDGLRTVIFFSGCPLRCSYCHNPDTWSQPKFKEYTVKELTDFCVRYKNYYGKCGGVTLSGGEPLAQAQFVLQLIISLQAQGLNVAIDTSGAVYAKEALLTADLIILDIKHTSDIDYNKLTGGKLSDTLKTLKLLKDNNKRFWVRQVIVPSVNDNANQILKLKEIAAGAEKIELLPFHQMGRHKWEELNIAYPFADMPECDKKVILQLAKLLDS